MQASFNAIFKRLDISIVCQTDVTLKIVLYEEKTYVALMQMTVKAEWFLTKNSKPAPSAQQ